MCRFILSAKSDRPFINCDRLSWLCLRTPQQTGAVSQLMGAVSQLMGAASQLMGAASQLMGAASQLMGAVSQLMGAVSVEAFMKFRQLSL
ncbi:hypothetical protein [Nostoc sp.]